MGSGSRMRRRRREGRGRGRGGRGNGRWSGRRGGLLLGVGGCMCVRSGM
jgi:hypothetical protein